MGIDRETKMKYINIVFDDNKKYLDQMRKQALQDDQNDEENGIKKMSISDEEHSFDMEEYYFDEDDCSLSISGQMRSGEGETGVYFTLPISDVVLIDILQHALKKLNKLKTAMETLK